MKSYTDLEQSKKLSEILPIESSDMEYILEEWIDEKTHRREEGYCEIPAVKVDYNCPLQPTTLPCWSLAALLEILDPMVIAEKLQYQILIENYDWKYHIIKYFPESNGPVKRVEGETMVDAAFKMIVYLKENKLI